MAEKEKQLGLKLTFAKKNMDIYRLLEEKKVDAEENQSKFVATDYICEAIRFFEANKDKNDVDRVDIKDMVEKLVNEKLEVFKKEFVLVANQPTTNSYLEDVSGISNIEED